MDNIKRNDIIPLTITDINSRGQGVGRYNGVVVFVPNTAAGDIITAKVVNLQKSHVFAVLESIETPSLDRAENQCPVYPECGGCTLRHMSYPAQLNAKYSLFADNLKRIGGINIDLEKIISSPLEDRYRNKAQYPVQLVNGKPKIGFYQQRSHKLIPIDDCLLQPEIFSQISNTFIDFLERENIPPYDEETRTGVVRHLVLRSSSDNSEIMVTVVINGSKLKNSNLLVELLTSKYPQIKTITLNHNTQKSNVILSNKSSVIYGDGVIWDSLAGVNLQLSDKSFYQVNHGGAELLYKKAIEYAQPKKTDLLLDLYCGIGSIGLSMSKDVNQLIGVEIVKKAAEDATANAKANDVSNAKFIAGDAGAISKNLAKKKLSPDIIVVDPPRKGLDKNTINAIGEMHPSRVVYVSCNSATLARDAKRLSAFGYNAIKGCAVDLFPQTAHIECVIGMQRKDT